MPSPISNIVNNSSPGLINPWVNKSFQAPPASASQPNIPLQMPNFNPYSTDSFRTQNAGAVGVPNTPDKPKVAQTDTSLGGLTPPTNAGAGANAGTNTQPLYGANNTGNISPQFPGLVSRLGATAGTSTPEYQAAQEQYLGANQKLADLRQQEAIQNANIMGSRTNLSEAGGEQGLLQTLAAGKEAALTGEMSATQAAAQTATGQQQAEQAGLAAAGGLAQPSQAGPTNVPFNPITGEYGTPAAGAFGQGGLQGVGAIQGQIGVGQNVTQLNSYLGGAQVVGKNLQDLISSANINPVGLTYANGLLQFGAKAMSDPNYQKFAGQINDFVASLAPILGVGGNVTDMKTQMSSAIVNALQSGRTINDVVGYFLDQAQQKVQGLARGGGVGVGGAINSNGTTNSSQFSW